MFKLALCSIAALACLASPTFAADPANPPVLAAETAADLAARKAVPSTGDFLARVTAANRFEIDGGTLALKKSGNAAVKEFAQRMVADHTEAAAKLQKVLGEALLSAGPDALDARHRVVLDDLAKKDGADFDKAYIEAETKAHERTVALFQAYAEGGDNPRLKQFAQELLPALKMGLESVQKLKV